MRLEQLEQGQIDLLRVVAEDLPEGLARDQEIQLLRPDGVGEVLLLWGDEARAVCGQTRSDVALLSSLCTRGLPRICWVLERRDPGELVIQVHSFRAEIQVGALVFGLDDKAMEDARRHNPRVRSIGDAIAWLTDQCLLPGGPAGVVRAFLSGGREGDLQGGFAVHGRGVRVFVRRPEGQEIPRVDRIVRGRAPAPPTEQVLAVGAISFADGTQEGQMRGAAHSQLAQILEGEGSTIDLWTRYGEAEGRLILERAREFGVLAYTRFERLPDERFRFYLADGEDVKQAWEHEELEAGEAPPLFLKQRGMSWAEYERLERESAPKAGRRDAFVGEVKTVEAREGAITLRRARSGDDAPPAEGFLFISILGDRPRLRRQREAIALIREGKAPMWQLGLLLEGRDVPAARHGTLTLSRAVRRKIFGERGPTRRQQEALRVALNTPDIALIQGPPGTGKTTVITALAEQLNEVLGDEGGIAGQVLVSGFQHDAVDNVVARLLVNGLPAIKFGARGGADEDRDRTDEVLEGWCQAAAERLRALQPATGVSALEAKVADLARGYLLAPAPREETAALLDEVLELVMGHVPAALIDELRALRDRLQRQDTGFRPAFAERARLVRALRTTDRAFADDGALNAERLRRAPEKIPLAPEERDLLAQAAGWAGAGPPPFLDRLAALRRRLLRALVQDAPDPLADRRPRLLRDVQEALARTQEALAQGCRPPGNAIDDAAAELLAVLEGNPERIKHAILNYMTVYAATCQQSVRLREERKGDGEPYDTVVVDEAARANPLDLFIPMVQARRRLILVGDHRQLPHLLDHALERELERDLQGQGKAAAERARELLRESLFHRLFLQLREREKRDGVRRTVTLDEQYRMHPLLGEFVCQSFYPPEEAFRSPLPAEAFAHELPGYAGPAAWIDVPQSAGPEQGGQSKSRRSEAKRLAEELLRLIECPTGAGLSFGVITFYSAQVEEIRRALHEVGLVDEEGQVASPYRATQGAGARRERLRFGTVDAFQGMEFDVVFLSVVRSNRLPDRDEAQRRRKYGHLMSPNRMCVAMSRQRRLLIGVGDAALLREPSAEAAIGPLVRFHALCQRHHAS